jgi:dihydrofolate reductase
MRKLILQVQVSADGFVCSPTNEQTFMTWDSSKDMIAYMEAIWGKMDTVIMGSGMAHDFMPHWQAKAQLPDDKENAWGKLFTNVPKVVFSKKLHAGSPEAADWKNVSFANGDLAEEVNTLKRNPGRDIITYGGAGFGASLVKHKLIDEFYLFVHPAAIGKGRSPFANLEDVLWMKLVEAKPFDCGTAVLKYIPA